VADARLVATLLGDILVRRHPAAVAHRMMEDSDDPAVGELDDIEPFHVAAYLKALKVSDAGNRSVKERPASRPTAKQHLAAIRMLFDWLIVGQVLAINPGRVLR